MAKRGHHIQAYVITLDGEDYKHLKARHAALKYGVPDIPAMLRAEGVPATLIDDLVFALGTDGACRLAALWYAQDIGGLLATEGDDDGG